MTVDNPPRLRLQAAGLGDLLARLGRGISWRDIPWRVVLLVAGAFVAYVALRRPGLGEVALFGLAVLPVALLRPDLVATCLVPLALVMPILPPGGEALLAAGGLLVIGAVLVRTTALPGVRPRRPGWPVLCVAGMLVMLFTSVTSHVAPDLTFLAWGLLVLAAVTVVPPDVSKLSRVVVISGAVIATYVMVSGVYSGGRLVGLSLNTNYLGALLAAPLAAGVALARVQRRLIWLLAPAICAVGVVQTHSRGALLAACTGSAVALIAGRRPRVQIPVISAAVLICAAAIASPLQTLVLGGRTAADLHKDAAIRARAAKLAFDVAVQHPLRGIGYEMFPQLAANDQRLGIEINTHNDYLRLAAEVGSPTLLLFLALLIGGLIVARRAVIDQAAPLLPIYAVVVSHAVTLLFANTLANPIVSGSLWVCLGCLLANRSATARRLPAKESVHA